MSAKMVSLIIPIYNESENIEELHKQLTNVLSKLQNIMYELIFVDDGSVDDSWEKLTKLRCNDNNVKGVKFSRNFGHQIALTAGLDKARGDACIVIDGDLQDPPEVIINMIHKWQEGFQVVYGVRIKRDGESNFKKFTAFIFYRILRKLTRVDIPIDTGDFRLMDRVVVDQLILMREKNRFVRGMVSWVGFKQTRVHYEREKRFAGKTKYPFSKMFKLALNGILSFSQIPLQLSSTLGFLCSFISFIFILYGLYSKIFDANTTISGWTSLFIAVLFIGGIQLMTIGILGEYLGRVYEEIKNRPLYIVEEEVNFN